MALGGLPVSDGAAKGAEGNARGVSEGVAEGVSAGVLQGVSKWTLLAFCAAVSVTE